MLQILYEAPEYRGRGLIVTLLAIRAMVGSAYISANHALLAIEKPLASLYCSLAGLIATVVLGLLLIPVYGILGGAIAMLIGTGIEVITIFCGYIFVLGHYRQERVRNVQTANK